VDGAAVGVVLGALPAAGVSERRPAGGFPRRDAGDAVASDDRAATVEVVRVPLDDVAVGLDDVLVVVEPGAVCGDDRDDVLAEVLDDGVRAPLSALEVERRAERREGAEECGGIAGGIDGGVDGGQGERDRLVERVAGVDRIRGSR